MFTDVKRHGLLAKDERGRAKPETVTETRRLDVGACQIARLDGRETDA